MKINNEYKITPEFLAEYFLFYRLKNFLIFCGIMFLVGIINLIVLTITSIIGDVTIGGIILDMIVTILFAILFIMTPAIIANIEYNKFAKFGDVGLNFRYVFCESNYKVIKGEYVLEQNYEDIKSIYRHEKFTVIVTKDKKKYILNNNSFDCDIEEFFIFLGKDE